MRSTRACSPHFELRLEPDQAEVIAGQVVLPQLHDRVGLPPGARIDEPHGLHRPEAQRVAPAVRHHLDRQAPLEERLTLSKSCTVADSACDQRVVERVVLLAA